MPGDGGEDQVLAACCTLQARLFLLNDKVAEQLSLIHM